MTTKHTSGIWTVTGTKKAFLIGEDDGNGGETYIAKIDNIDSESEENAKLIAAAPELLQALFECKKYFEYMGGDNHVASREARKSIDTAINKATP